MPRELLQRIDHMDARQDEGEQVVEALEEPRMRGPTHQRTRKPFVEGKAEADNAVVREHDLFGSGLMRHRCSEAGEEEGATALAGFLLLPLDPMDREPRPCEQAGVEPITDDL